MLPFWEILETKEEQDKFIVLYTCFKNPLFSVAQSILNDNTKAEDMVHETFLTLIDNLDHIEAEVYVFLENYAKEAKQRKNLALKDYAKKTDNYIYAKALSYSITILKNKITDMYRKDVRQSTIYVEEYFDNISGSTKDSPDSMVMAAEFNEYLNALIRKLRYPYKNVLYLRYYNELSIEEIGKLLDKKPDNIRKIISRAKNILKEQLKKEGYYA